MKQRKVFFKMFKEIIKHAERDNCYDCKQVIKALNLKQRMEYWEKEGFW